MKWNSGKKQLRSLALLLLLFYTCLPVRAQHAVDLAQLDTYLQQALKEWKVPGMAVGIVQNDSLIFAKGYGVREAGKTEPVDPHTLFAIASNSKAFTAAALGVLVDEGKISWDDPVTKYLPDFQLYDPYASREMKVRDLLCHRSGLKTFSGDLVWFGTDLSRQEVVRRARYLKPSSSFRSEYGYQNIMFVAAGEIIPAVTGKSWEAFVQERFFQPLAMSRTGTSVTQLPQQANVALPHITWQGKTLAVAYLNYDNFAPAGSINSSVADMSRWIRLQLNRGTLKGKKYFSEDVSREMWMPHTVIRTSKNSERLFPSRHFQAYGLGWQLMDLHGRKIVTHSGGLEGMISQVAMVPEEKLGFVILTNGETSLPAAVMYELLDRYLKGASSDWSKTFLELRKKGEEAGAAAREKAEKERAKNTKPSLPLEQYAGTYHSDLYGDVRVRQEGKKLILEMVHTKNFKGELSHWQYDTFTLNWTVPNMLPPGKVQFQLDMAGKADELKMDVPDPDFDFTELVLKKVKESPQK